MCVYRLSSLSRSGTLGRRELGSWEPEVGKSGCSSRSAEDGYHLLQVKHLTNIALIEFVGNLVIVSYLICRIEKNIG